MNLTDQPYVVAGLDYLCGLQQKNEVTLSGQCHPNTGVTATYKHWTNVLELRCSTCDKFVANIAVASAH